MTKKTFMETLRFAKNIRPKCILISGGEPTDHPEFFEFMEILKHRGLARIVVITSNGLFLRDKEFTDKICNLGMFIQVINDKKYYPIHVADPNHPKIHYFDNIPAHLTNFGRARENKLEITRKSPCCYNLRSISWNMDRGLEATVYILATKGFLCTPYINVSGNITAGGGEECIPFGHVTDSMSSLSRNINNLKCNRCGMWDNLSKEQKENAGYGV